MPAISIVIFIISPYIALQLITELHITTHNMIKIKSILYTTAQDYTSLHVTIYKSVPYFDVHRRAAQYNTSYHEITGDISSPIVLHETSHANDY